MHIMSVFFRRLLSSIFSSCFHCSFSDFTPLLFLQLPPFHHKSSCSKFLPFLCSGSSIHFSFLSLGHLPPQFSSSPLMSQLHYYPSVPFHLLLLITFPFFFSVRISFPFPSFSIPACSSAYNFSSLMLFHSHWSHSIIATCFFYAPVSLTISSSSFGLNNGLGLHLFSGTHGQSSTFLFMEEARLGERRVHLWISGRLRSDFL